MALDLVQRYNTRDLAVQVDSGARTVLPGTNVTFSTDPVTGAITINSTAGGSGTVTSVGATGSTGLTIGGTNPITSSGTTTFTLSANLQAWHALATSAKENAITAGTTAQYWRGDKSWQTLDKAAVGLGNVDNTSDVNKPVSTAQATADNLRVLKAGDIMTGLLNVQYAAPAINISDTTGAAIGNGGQLNLQSANNSATQVPLLQWKAWLTNGTPGSEAGGGRLYTRNAGAMGLVAEAFADKSTVWESSMTVKYAVFSTGAVAGFSFQDRVTSVPWVWYATGSIARLYNGTTDVMQVDLSGNVSALGTLSDSIGNVRDIPQNAQNTNYTVVLTDRGKHIYSNNTTNYNWTIPTNATTAFPIGSTITFIHDSTSGTKTIVRAGGVALINGTTDADFALTAGMVRTILKVGSDRWRVV